MSVYIVIEEFLCREGMSSARMNVDKKKEGMCGTTESMPSRSDIELIGIEDLLTSIALPDKRDNRLSIDFITH